MLKNNLKCLSFSRINEIKNLRFVKRNNAEYFAIIYIPYRSYIIIKKTLVMPKYQAKNLVAKLSKYQKRMC